MSESAPFGRRTVLAEAERVLRQNWVEGSRGGTRFSYTEPSPGRYPWQWYCNSCFAAIVWRRFEPARARAELESLLAAQRPDGFLGHTIFWRSHVSWLRLLFYNVANRRAEGTETIQPPLLAWAWRIAVGDPNEEPRIAQHMDWLARNRDLEGDGLLWIVQPDESGLDASPKFEEVWGGGRTAASASRCWSTATAGWAGTRGGSATPAVPSSARPWSTPSGRSRCRRGPALGDAGAGRPTLGRAPRPLPRRSPARRSAPADADLGLAGAPGAARSAGGDRPAPGRGAPAERARVPHPGRAALGRGRRARLRTRRWPRPDPPLLARPDLDQLELDRLAGPPPARPPSGGSATGRP